ncbi:hypothetical protein ABVK25_011565 [Lepraria finkii]|uniref:Glucose-methanol-choline oxidoreductase N-terminal domain-containing protein n=1 Tax=Lepraria finkii TaxID=1340010 RepID=A0ABR4AMQ0_9LECA
MNGHSAGDIVESFLEHKFTHIVVGGGTAGLVVAARLSENPNITVGVLEAGVPAYDDPRITVPGRFGETLGSEYDWQFATMPQPGLGGRSLQWPRGRVLGGTSALNFMTWNRGCREDYDAWEELGNEGWGWDALLPFFKKTETFHEPDAEHQALHKSIFDKDFHGTEGPLQSVYSTNYGASHQHWHATCHKLGIKTNSSHFSGSNVGCWTSLTGVTADTRERSYSATAYYKPNAKRPNLVLLTDAFVKELILEKEGGEWVTKGVKFTHIGQEHVVRLDGEVIISGGSVQSPQLLEVSGIGNPEILKAAGIETKVDNPNVGEHLQEHMMTAMIVEIDSSIITPEDLRADPALAEAADKEYALKQTGPRTAIPSSVSYLPFSHFVPSKELHALGSHLLAESQKDLAKFTSRDRILIDRLLADKNLGQIEYNFDVSNYSPYFKSLPGKKYATMLQMLQYPFSKGSIHIPAVKDGKKTTMDDKPVIDPRYYCGAGGEVDFKLMVASQEFADKICAMRPLADIIVSRVYPPASTQDKGTDFDFSDWVRESTITDWHPVGTCSMGGKRRDQGRRR